MNPRTKRISKELQLFHKDPPQHIYLDYGDDLTHIEVLFIGPRLSPYSRMFLRFSVDFPDTYPINPPKVVFTSSYGYKIHPNIFPGGWICLSTLTTGDSSGWAPSISFTALLTTIYSMLTKEMIEIDNTHEHEKGDKFFPGIMFDTFSITSKLLKEEKNQKLKEIMDQYVKRHSKWYIRKLQRLSEKHDGQILPNYYKVQNRKANFNALIELYRGYSLEI